MIRSKFCWVLRHHYINSDDISGVYIYQQQVYSIDFLIFFSILLYFYSKLLLNRTITFKLNGARIQNFHSCLLFSTEVFFWTKGRGLSFFLYTISTHSQTFRHLFAVLHLRWLISFFTCSSGNYHTFILRNYSASGIRV